LTLQCTSKYLLNHTHTTTTTVLNPFPSEFFQTQTRIMARINHIPQKFVSIFLSSTAKMLSKNLQTALNLSWRVKREIQTE
jgi:hypothetical protein